MKTSRYFFVAALLAATVSPAAHAAVVYDNMFQANTPILAGDPLSDDQPLGASFTTGSSGVLGAIHLALELNAAADDGAFLVSVVPDAGNTPDLTPGNALWTSSSILDSSFTANTPGGYWDPALDPTAAGVGLAAGTRYWVVLNGDPDSVVSWDYVTTPDTSGIGVAGELWYSAGATGPNETGPYVMSVDVTAAPEPVSLAIFGLGLVGLGAARFGARSRSKQG
jgi:hypothetical protein